jgi:hypothetical protein
MTQPSVIITELDGALGVLPPSAGRLHAIVGPTSMGTPNVPATFVRIQDIQANFGDGGAIESAAHYMGLYGRPVLFVKSDASALAVVEPIDVDGVTGTSVITQSGTPVDDYEIVFKVKTGGTIATSGIKYIYSLDAGRTFSAEQSLGTASTAAIGTTGMTLHFAAGTLIAGDVALLNVLAPSSNAADLTPALAALKATQVLWELCQIVPAIDPDILDAVDLAFAGMASAGKYRGWVGNTRVPNVGETESAYFASLETAFASKASKYGSLYSGACKLTSSISGRKFRRPVSFSTAAREAFVSQEIDIADVNLGTLEGVSIRDVNGNPDEHDESLNPGLDDLRFGTLRTWDGEGVYVNRPRLFSPNGSDFQLMPHRRVMNLAMETLRSYFIRRLNRPVLVSSTTGFILESEALEIEAGVMAQLRAQLLAKPKASAVQFTLSRTDNLLSTRTLTGSARVIPLAYPEDVELDVGFYNPALQVLAA